MMRVVLLLALVAVCLASCHHHCNYNGDCEDDVCNCNEGWTGTDCSVPYLPLNDGESVSQTVPGDWVYYYTDVSTTPLWLNYTMTDGTFGDCDLYIRRDEFPSKNHYDYKDNGWDSNSYVDVPFPEAGLWIAGVYNYLNCNYNLLLTIEESGNCPNSCSGHGTCDIDNTCICNNLFYGEDCSQAVLALGDGSTSYDNSVMYWEWQFYYFDSVVNDEGTVPNFRIVVNQTTEHADTDLYIKFGEQPTLWDFDYRNAAVIDDYALTVGSPVEGRYFIGIYGYTECDYSIELEFQEEVPCELTCSGHGFCSGSICHCNALFDGEHCEYMTVDLTEGAQVTGFASDNTWNYYTATANSANNMVITVDQDFTVGGDCDLYIRANEDPDRFTYDHRNIGFDDSFSVVVQNPLETTWHIGVYGYRSCQYFLTETIENNACPNDCSDHGNCVNGRCACSSGYAGQNCGSTLERIISGEVKESTVGQNQWAYYKFTAPNVETSITVYLHEEAPSEGALGLYVLEGAPPELTGFEYSDTEISAYHSIYFRFDGTSDQDHDFYIGVYGTANIGINAERNFQLFAYSPPI